MLILGTVNGKKEIVVFDGTNILPVNPSQFVNHSQLNNISEVDVLISHREDEISIATHSSSSLFNKNDTLSNRRGTTLVIHSIFGVSPLNSVINGFQTDLGFIFSVEGRSAKESKSSRFLFLYNPVEHKAIEIEQSWVDFLKSGFNYFIGYTAFSESGRILGNIAYNGNKFFLFELDSTFSFVANCYQKAKPKRPVFVLDARKKVLVENTKIDTYSIFNAYFDYFSSAWHEAEKTGVGKNKKYLIRMNGNVVSIEELEKERFKVTLSIMNGNLVIN